MTAAASTGTSGYSLLLADDATQVAAAQRLRHQVFAGELGARLTGAVDGRDVDEFDDYCDHLIVRDDANGEVVGTYRMMPPKAAERAGRRYGDSEFDLSGLRPMRDQLVETGRSCVHPDHRSGAVVNLMWAGLARYLHLNNLRWLGGCAFGAARRRWPYRRRGVGPGAGQAPLAARAAGDPAPALAGRDHARRRPQDPGAAAAQGLPAAG